MTFSKQWKWLSKEDEKKKRSWLEKNEAEGKKDLSLSFNNEQINWAMKCNQAGEVFTLAQWSKKRWETKKKS